MILAADAWEKRATRETIVATENFMFSIFGKWYLSTWKDFWFEQNLLILQDFILFLCDKNITAIVCSLIGLSVD